jgi:hypothetical protein
MVRTSRLLMKSLKKIQVMKTMSRMKGASLKSQKKIDSVNLSLIDLKKFEKIYLQFFYFFSIFLMLSIIGIR